jgi:hypothetical protein
LLAAHGNNAFTSIRHSSRNNDQRRTQMLKPVIAALVFATVSLSSAASEGDCFPMCDQAAENKAAETKPAEIKVCDLPGVRTVEEINTEIKPVKEIVGYVRSPQGLAIKLVNDHVFKIPAWVGYAVDPVGSLKRRAIDEVRTKAKEMIGVGKDGCTPTEEQPTETAPFAPEIPGTEEA